MTHDMKLFRYIKIGYVYFRQLSLYKTLRTNFQLFPFKTAIKLPIFLLRGTTIEIGKEASVTLNCAYKTGLIWIGGLNTKWIPKGSSNNVSIDGNVVVSGRVCIGYNANVIVGKGAKLIFGGENYINHDSKIFAHDEIILEYGSRVGWNSQICDTAFHYISVDNVVSRKTKPIYIGREAWVSSYCNVGRGSVLPDHSILSTCSLLNKDFSESGTNLLIAGIPAKVIKTNVHRIMETVGNNAEICEEIDNYFNRNKDAMKLNLTELNNNNENR